MPRRINTRPVLPLIQRDKSGFPTAVPRFTPSMMLGHEGYAINARRRHCTERTTCGCAAGWEEAIFKGYNDNFDTAYREANNCGSMVYHNDVTCRTYTERAAAMNKAMRHLGIRLLPSSSLSRRRPTR